MSRFSESLKLALAELHLSQTTFANDCDIPRPHMSKYVSGALVAGAVIVEKIAAALPEKQRAAVVVAYLRDRVPECARELVKISAVLSKPTRGAIPDDLTGPARAALVSLAKMAARDSDLRDVLIWLDKQVR